MEQKKSIKTYTFNRFAGSAVPSSNIPVKTSASPICLPIKRFDIEIKLILARVVSSHVITESDGKTIVTFEAEIRGPLALIWKLALGKNIKNKIPIEMIEMVKIAEKLVKEKANS